ncbi:MAG: DUF58 domain-containing protein [Planctomycetes bacterium]|nr:DUF58 domain-containing protein [Planctomycetota bacterium]
MPRPSPEAAKCAAVYRLALPERVGHGLAGERLGRASGTSLEFQDRRPYVIGDDVRHIDWRAMARTDQMLVRVFREEIQPRVEILLDASASMAVDPGKIQIAVDLCAMLSDLALQEGFACRILRLGDRIEEIEKAAFDRLGTDADGRRPLEDALDAASPLLRPGSMRFVVSDFLSPHDPTKLMRKCASAAGSIALLQILASDDAAPPVGSALRLTDAESGAVLDLVLDEGAVRSYLQRLERLQSGLAAEALRAAGIFVSIESPTPLAEICRSRLLPAGVLTA